MTTHQATLEQWHESIANALRDGAVDAVPGILVLMARDGWGHEAEQTRREMPAAANPDNRRTLSELTGHDREAAQQLEILVGVYRRRGISGVRDAVDGFLQMSSAEADRTILVEAVLTLAEQGTAPARRAAEDFAQAEADTETASVRRGGGR
jgi:hypothetical protein